MPDVADEILSALGKCRRVLVTTHVRPDGDALGSTAAMMLAMKEKGIESRAILLSHLPTKYGFVYRECGIDFFDVEAGYPADFSLDEYDAFLVIDTGTWSQLPGMQDYVARFKGKKLVIDHHKTQENWADLKYVVTTAAAAGELVAEMIERWHLRIDAKMAMALYVAIASDTGWFQFSSTTPATMRLGAKLMEAGVDTDRLQQLLYQNERAERVFLQTRAMQSMKLLHNKQLATMQVSKADFNSTHATVNDTENMINTPLQIRTVEFSILFVEPPEGGPIRVSFRSKGKIDCAKFAEQFAGGGHARAAGAKITGTLTEVFNAVTERAEKAIEA